MSLSCTVRRNIRLSQCISSTIQYRYHIPNQCVKNNILQHTHVNIHSTQYRSLHNSNHTPSAVSATLQSNHQFYTNHYDIHYINTSDNDELSRIIPLMHDMNKVRGRDFTDIDITVAQRKSASTLNSSDRYSYDSYICLHYNFAANDQLKQKYNLFNTNKMRIGRILEDADALSGDVCYKHIGIRHDRHVTCVTATIDRVDMFRSLPHSTENSLPPDSLECDWVMSGKITWVGNTSMEVRIDIGRIIDDQIQQLGNAFFVFVARDKSTYKKYIVPKLQLISDIDQQLFDDGIQHNIKRRERINNPHQLQLPNNDELIQLHKLYLETRQNIPCTYHGYSTKTMSATHVSKVSLMHSQDRNIHNKMFGGHLLRLAFELSWACAYMTTHTLPKLQIVDDIHFYLPVEIGSLLTFDSEIWYINPHDSTVFVNVQAKVIDTSTGHTKHTSNEFYFQFVCDTHDKPLPYIIPESYEEMMKYLEGRRRNKEFQSTYTTHKSQHTLS